MDSVITKERSAHLAGLINMLLHHPDQEERKKAAKALVGENDPFSRDALIIASGDRDDDVARQANQTLVQTYSYHPSSLTPAQWVYFFETHPLYREGFVQPSLKDHYPRS